MKLETASFLEISQLLKHSDRSLEELLSFTFESSPFAVFILRLIEEDNVPVDYEYVYVNSACKNMLDISREELIGKTYRQFFSSETDPNIDVYYQAVKYGSSGQQILYSAPIDTYVNVTYSKFGEDLCFVTSRPVGNTMVDAHQTLAASLSAFDMVISVNLTQNSYHMINYENFHQRKADYSGVFDDLIKVGASTLPPQWQQKFLDTFHREAQLASFQEGNHIITLEHQQYSEDGSIHWVRTQVIGIENDMSDDVLQVTTAKLIDEQKDLEERLLKERRAAYDTIPGTIVRCLIDDDLHPLEWNRDYSDTIDFREYADKSFLDNIHRDDRQRVEETIRRNAIFGRPIRIEHREYDKEGKLCWVRKEGRKIGEQDGFPVYLFISFDMTKTVETTRALDEEREKYKSLYETVPCAITEYIVSPDATLRGISCNPEARRIMGCASDEGYQKFCAETSFKLSDLLYQKKDVDYLKAQYKKLKNIGDVVKVQCYRRIMDGSPLYVLGTLELLARYDDGSSLVRAAYFDIDDQKRAELERNRAQRELAQKSEALRLGFINTRTTYFYFYPQERLLMLGEDSYNLENSALIYRNAPRDIIEDYMAPEFWEKAKEHFDRASHGEEDIQFDYRSVRGDLWRRVRFSATRCDSKGNATQVMGFINDITKEKSRTFLTQEVLDGIANGFAYIHRVHVPSRTYSAIKQNNRLDKMVGVKGNVDQLLEDLTSRVFLPESKDIYVKFMDIDRIRTVFNWNHTTETMDIKFTYTGVIQWYNVTIILASMKEDKVESYLVVWREITDEKEAELETSKSVRERNELSEAISVMYRATYLIDLKSDKYHAIKAPHKQDQFFAFSGRFSKDMASHAGRMREEDRESFTKMFNRENLMKHLSGENPSITAEFPLVYEEKEIWLRFIAVLTSLENGLPEGAVFITQDVTAEREEELRQKEALRVAFDSARRANEAKSEFLSRMSHDIRTPMNAIMGMAAIAGSYMNDGEKVKDCLNKINTASNHLLNLINEVLDMSKIEAGCVSLIEEDFNMSELVNNLLEIIKPEIDKRKQEFTIHIENILHEDVIGDSMHVQKALMNFLSNAVKYTPDGGKIQVFISEKPTNRAGVASYEFIFKDSGYGISPAFIQHIFEPFSREEDSRTSKIQGTGLGMAIANNIVHMMDGTIQVDSHQGLGSTFTVTIHLKVQAEKKEMLDVLAGRAVFIVNTEETACKNVCNMLKSIGVRGAFATSAKEAITSIKEKTESGEDFFAIIIDLKLSDMNGIALTNKIRQAGILDVPIIISAYDWSNVEIQARNAGADGFLPKPIFKSRLIHMLKGLAGLEDAAPVEPMDKLQAANYVGKRILLVEDNDLNREIARELLSMTGAVVDTAFDGQDAVEQFAASRVNYYDLIIMDIQMPMMNGYEAAAFIRKLDREDAGNVPIFAMTANAFAEDVALTRRAGMNEHIAKPIDIDALMKAMGRWMN